MAARKRGRPRKAKTPEVSSEYLKRVDDEIVDRVQQGALPRYLALDSHFSLDPEKRKPGMFYPAERYEKVEQLIDDVVSDVINGMSKSQIYSKMENGDYPYGKVPKGHKSQMMKYALHRMRWNREASYEEHRDILWTRYENLYRMAIDEKDLSEARHCLSDMSRIFGLDSDRTMEMTKVDDGKVVIRFGFNQGNENQIEAEDVEYEDTTDKSEDNDDEEVPF